MSCIMCELSKGNIPYLGIFKKYKYWTVMISREQHTLGTLILFLNRHTVRFSSLRKDELLELNKVQKKMEKTLDSLFSPDLYNYLQCGNSVEHLHFHLLPRYKREKSFKGRKFKDVNYGDSVKEARKIEKPDFINELKKRILKELRHR